MVEQTVILAAGRGTRMRLLTRDKPKCLTRLLGVPIIEWTLSTLEYLGINDIIVVTGWMGYKIKRALNHWRNRIKLRFVFNRFYAKYENAVSILAASRHLKEEFLVLMSDHFYSIKIIEKMLEQTSFTMGVDSQPNPAVDIEEATKVLVLNGIIKSIGKKIKQFNAIDIGAFVLDRSVLHFIKKAMYRGKASLSEVVLLMIKNGFEFRAFDIKGAFWIDIDTPKDLKKAEEYVSRFFGKYRRILQDKMLSSIL